MNFDMNEGRKGPEWPWNEFLLLDSPTLLIMMLTSDAEELVGIS